MPKGKTQQKKTSIFAAISGGDLQTIQNLPEAEKYLLEGTNIHGDQPLHLAIRHKNIAMVSYLLGQGVAVTHANKMGHTPLHVAALADQLDIAKMLLQIDKPWCHTLTAKDGRGRTPLACARDKKHKLMEEWLLTEEGAGEPSLLVRAGTAMLNLVFGTSATVSPAQEPAITAPPLAEDDWVDVKEPVADPAEPAVIAWESDCERDTPAPQKLGSPL